MGFLSPHICIYMWYAIYGPKIIKCIFGIIFLPINFFLNLFNISKLPSKLRLPFFIYPNCTILWGDTLKIIPKFDKFYFFWQKINSYQFLCSSIKRYKNLSLWPKYLLFMNYLYLERFWKYLHVWLRYHNNEIFYIAKKWCSYLHIYVYMWYAIYWPKIIKCIFGIIF